MTDQRFAVIIALALILFAGSVGYLFAEIMRPRTVECSASLSDAYGHEVIRSTIWSGDE